MTVKSFFKLALLIFPFSLHAFAETNVEGDEIVIQNNTASDKNSSSSLILDRGIQTDPAHSYLPDPVPADDDQSATSNSEDLRQRIIDGYTMPEVQSGYTANHESWYASRPEYVRRMVERSQKYLYHIVVEVEKRGMPTEIALLPMIESAFNPQANSTSRASGIWQFIPSTGKNFGLKQNWWVDNRRNVTAATNAALTYLQKLHVMFGTWDLALAAYNAGEGTVQRAIERNRKKGLPTDYASLSLPPETRNYVPKLQAVKNIMTNPELYGLNIQPIANRPYFIKVNAPEQIDAKLAAQLAEISFEEFTSLNPEYNRPVVTTSGSVHEILLPVSAATTFKNNLASYDKPLVNWQTYHAKRGERTDNIARKFGISLAQLRDVNDLPSSNKIGGARPILVPSSGAEENDHPINTDESAAPTNGAEDADQAPSKREVTHTVKNKETMASIAKHYGTSPKHLMAMNHLKNSRVKVGQTLTITTEESKVTKNNKKTNPNTKSAKGKKPITSSKRVRSTTKSVNSQSMDKASTHHTSLKHKPNAKISHKA